MRIFGFSVVTLFIILAAFILGAKNPGVLGRLPIRV